MPIFFQQEIEDGTRLAIWKIEEPEAFFDVPLQRDITHPHKRQQHLAGRYLLRYLFPDFPLALIKIADTRKPYLDDEAYHFSISHCGDYAAVIASKTKRVGIDIEVPSTKVEKIKHKFLHREELAILESDETNNQPSSMSNFKAKTEGKTNEDWTCQVNPNSQTLNSKLTLLWSAKEAVFKWWSYGHVDFSDMIRLQPFSLGSMGQFQACFVKENQEWPLTIQYQVFEDVCLAWVANEFTV